MKRRIKWLRIFIIDSISIIASASWEVLGERSGKDE